HEVGRELDALELEVKNLGDGLYQQSLGQARRAGDEAMPPREQREQELLNNLLLADNDFRELVFNLCATGREPFKRLALVKLRGRECFFSGGINQCAHISGSSGKKWCSPRVGKPASRRIRGKSNRSRLRAPSRRRYRSYAWQS